MPTKRTAVSRLESLEQAARQREKEAPLWDAVAELYRSLMPMLMDTMARHAALFGPSSMPRAEEPNER